jgi:hypothetical protein
MATMSHLFFYWLALIALVWLFLMLHSAWPRERAKHPQPAEREPLTSKRTCSKEPKPFAGLTQRPQCALCEREAAHPCGTMGSTAAWNRPPQPVAFAHGHWRPATAGGPAPGVRRAIAVRAMRRRRRHPHQPPCGIVTRSSGPPRGRRPAPAQNRGSPSDRRPPARRTHRARGGPGPPSPPPGTAVAPRFAAPAGMPGTRR